MLAIIAIILSLLTGQTWQSMPVNGHVAVCEITISHGQTYANNCFR
jgi:hypothetical protein